MAQTITEEKKSLLTERQKNLLDRIKNKAHLIGHLVGFRDLTELHGKWINNFWKARHQVYVLQSHRGSFKTSCIALFIALVILLRPNENIFYVRKTETLVKDIVAKVSKILQSDVFQGLASILYGYNYRLIKNTATEIDTSLPHGDSKDVQFIGFGIDGKMTGRHCDWLIGDDLCFVRGTKIATPFGDRNIEDLRVGDFVLTPIGYKRIINISSHEDEVITNCGLTGTKKHPIYNFRQNKFDFLIASDYNNCSKLRLRELLQWQIAKILSNGMADNGNEQAESIISYGQILNTEQVKCYIEQYGKSILAKFLKVMLFTIKTIIPIIMTLVIWNVYQIGNIVKCTCENLKELLNPKKIYKKLLCRNLKNGENQKKDKKDLKNTVKDWQNKILKVLLMLYVQDVGNRLKCTQQEERGFVENVENIWQVKDTKKKGRLKDRLILAILKLFVPNVEKFTEHNLQEETKTAYVKIVLQENDIKNKNKQKVYNIEVEGIHCYYANGILVHNCDINDRNSLVTREHTKDVWRELYANILKPTGRAIVLGTPWSESDVFSIMPKADKYDCYTTGLLTGEQIEEKRKQTTPALFAANYELKFIADEDAIFTNYQILYDKDIGFNLTGSDVIKGGVCHVDAAFFGGDTTAFTVLKKTSDGRYIVFGKMWTKHVQSCIEEIIKLMRKYDANTLYLETNSDKGYLAKEFRERGIRCLTYHEKRNKYEKITSVLLPIWDKLYFIEDSDLNYINQVMTFSQYCEHDDCADSLASIVYRAESFKAKAIEGLNI